MQRCYVRELVVCWRIWDLKYCYYRSREQNGQWGLEEVQRKDEEIFNNKSDVRDRWKNNYWWFEEQQGE